jgi:hypothetical protein
LTQVPVVWVLVIADHQQFAASPGEEKATGVADENEQAFDADGEQPVNIMP